MIQFDLLIWIVVQTHGIFFQNSSLAEFMIRSPKYNWNCLSLEDRCRSLLTDCIKRLLTIRANICKVPQIQMVYLWAKLTAAVEHIAGCTFVSDDPTVSEERVFESMFFKTLYSALIKETPLTLDHLDPEFKLRHIIRLYPEIGTYFIPLPPFPRQRPSSQDQKPPLVLG